MYIVAHAHSRIVIPSVAEDNKHTVYYKVHKHKPQTTTIAIEQLTIYHENPTKRK